MPADQTLIEFCEPFFLQVGNVMRSVNYNPDSAYDVRTMLKAELDKLDRQASSRDGSKALSDDYHRIEPILAFFADGVIINSTLPFAPKWRDNLLLANDPRIGGITDGNVRFFLELDATLREGAGASERLTVFHTCLGLGFGGEHRDDPARLRQYSGTILRQIRGNRTSGDITPGHKEAIQGDIICNPIQEKMMAIAIVAGALILAIMVTYIFAREQANKDIGDTLKPIITAPSPS